MEAVIENTIEAENTADIKVTEPKAAAPADAQPAPVQNRYRKSEGKPSKAAQTRAIVQQMQDTAQRTEIVDAIQSQLGFSRPMARHYYYCAVAKLSA